MNDKISIIIPFYNEINNVRETINNAFQTCDNKNNVEVVVVNDGSTEKDLNVTKNKDFKYICNEKNMGVSYSREIGIMSASSKYIITTDAHVKFNKGWDRKIIERIDNNKTTIFCFACQDAEKKDIYYAGGFHFFPSQKLDLMLTPFLIRQEPPNEISDVPAVIGGSYAFYSPWYKHLGGMRGMKGWGVGETLLSLKSWLAGGYCKIDKGIKISHSFKKQNYVVDESCLHYNRMRLCKTILPQTFSIYPMLLKTNENRKKAMEEIIKDNKEILHDRIVCEDTLNVDINDFIKKFKLEICK